MKYPRRSSIVGIAILSFAIIYSLCLKKDYRLEFRKKSTVVVIGQISRVYRSPRGGGYSFDYSYSFNGRQFSNSRPVSDIVYSPERFDDKVFPVIFSKEDPGESAILITPDDFAFFNRDFPDSLNWVIQWVKTEH